MLDVNERREARQALDLSQAEAARRAGVSLATWRRWEEDPSAVKPKTAAACAKALTKIKVSGPEVPESPSGFADEFERAWGECTYLSPRQAYSLALTLDHWADMVLEDWLTDPKREPLHRVSPFHRLDLRVMMLIAENRAWVEAFRERCYAVAEEIAKGILPLDRQGCFVDELLIALAMDESAAMLREDPDAFEKIPARPGKHIEDGEEIDLDDDSPTSDDEWGLVSDEFDDRCRWDQWEVPAMKGYPLLPYVLADLHPLRWFDVGPGTGRGYLNELAASAAGLEE
jgi:transcriptional regulator with XRE-family HTH domain